MDTDTNRRTLASYESHVPEYISGTTQAVVGASKMWIDAALSGLSEDAAILELGSAFGRDAAYIASCGYSVECSDAAENFVSHLQAAGFTAWRFNAIRDELTTSYDLILANAVLLHFTRVEFGLVLKKLRLALKPGGRLAISLKRGDGEEWSEAKLGAPRYFCYWQPEQLGHALRAVGFAGWTVEEAVTDHTRAEWLYVIAKV